jgi:hypothetical protein
VKETDEKKKNEDDSSSSSSSSSTRNNKRFKHDDAKKGLNNLEFITSFGDEKMNDNEANVINNSLNEIRNKIDKNQLLTIKKLRRRSSSNSSTHSIKVTKKQTAKSKEDEDENDDESDEDEAIKEYLKRKQDRLSKTTTYEFIYKKNFKNFNISL